MKLIIIHYHNRPGGVRRIIELAVPYLVEALKVDSVTVAAGEAPDLHWKSIFTNRIAGVPVDFRTEPELGYLSELDADVSGVLARVHTILGGILQGADPHNCAVWAHNLSLARNPLLARALIEEAAARGIKLVAHHHDWWFDNRWQRWAELRQAGFDSLNAAAQIVLPAGPGIRHAAINRADAIPLERHFGRQAAWIPNLVESPRPPSPAKVREAQRWLRGQLGETGPVWILPCRLLRRKNVAEALLITRWLRPKAWLVTTGGVSSEDEQAYGKRLDASTATHGWRLRLGILRGEEKGKPGVPELLAASEAVVFSSIQEGFGLPYLEAAAAGRPLIARTLPNIAPDLARFGFRFPQSYDEILVDPTLFDWQGERHRQARLFREWQSCIPAECQRWIGLPSLLAEEAPRATPFSRLTLTAQLQVLAVSPERSWELCAPLNPFLTKWRDAAAKGRLEATPWPTGCERWLSGAAYADRFRRLFEGEPQKGLCISARDRADQEPAAGHAAQEEFLRERLAASNLFPLLWSNVT